MSEKTYLITGANRGLGLEFVRQISTASNSNIILACVRSLNGELDDLKALAKGKESQIHVIECDTGNVSSIRKCGEEVTKILSGRKLTYLLNNAGINSRPGRTALDVTAEEIRQHIEVNVIGPAEVVRAVEQHLGSGSTILNMTSGLGSIGLGIVKHTAYAISKGALNMLTVHQAEALKEKDVRVIVVDPGWVQTRMGGEGAVLTPEESISGMLKILHDQSKDDSGSFYRYNGEKLPW